MRPRPIMALLQFARKGAARLLATMAGVMLLFSGIVIVGIYFHAQSVEQHQLIALRSVLVQAQQQHVVQSAKNYALLQAALDERLEILQRVDGSIADLEKLAFAVDLNNIAHLLPELPLSPLPNKFWDALGRYKALVTLAYAEQHAVGIGTAVDVAIPKQGRGGGDEARTRLVRLRSELQLIKRIHAQWFAQLLNQVSSTGAGFGLPLAVATGGGDDQHVIAAYDASAFNNPLIQERVSALARDWVREFPEGTNALAGRLGPYEMEQAHQRQTIWLSVVLALVLVGGGIAVYCYTAFRQKILQLLWALQKQLHRPKSGVERLFPPGGYFQLLGDAMKDAVSTMATRMSVSERELNELREQMSDQSLVYQTIRAEVETPVLGLMLAIDQLGRSDLDGAQRENVANIRQHGRNVGRLISDFLGFASLETEVPHVPWMPCHVLGLVEAALCVGGTIMSEREVELLLCCAEDMPSYARVDVEALNLIVHNLLRHAAHVTQHGDIELKLGLAQVDELRALNHDAAGSQPSPTQAGAAAEFYDQHSPDLQDQMPGEDLIWETHFIKLSLTYGGNEPEITQLGEGQRIYSYHEVARSLERGAGLGLLVAKRKVELLGGVVKTQRERGVYNRIHAYLPYLPVVDHRPDPYQPLMSWRGLKVLIVVASRSLRTMLSDLVYQWGFVPFVVTSMAQAKELLRNQRQQMDCVLCDMDALSVSDTQWYRYFRVTTPFYYLTRIGQVPIFDHPLAGHSSTLTKPITPKALHHAFFTLSQEERQGEFASASERLSEDGRRAARGTSAAQKMFTGEKRSVSASMGSGVVLDREFGVSADGGTLGLDESNPGVRRSPRILLVEDNEVNIRVTKGLLNSLGFDIDVAVDGEEGWALICRNKYELVFMDLQLPRLDGHALAVRLRDANLKEKPKVVALTANTTLEDQRRCREAGMVGFIAKPFRRVELEACLTQWLGKPEI